MYTIAQIQAGAARYIDNDLAPSLNGWSKLILPVVSSLAISNAPALAERYRNHPVAVAIGVFDERGCIDVERIYQAACDRIGTEMLPIDIPKVGRIRIGKDDLDRLYKYITEA